MSKKTYTEIKADLDRELTELVYRTVEWAQREGCHRQAEGGAVLNYFLSRPSADANNTKPVWSEEFDESPFVWSDVVNKMIELNVPICAEPFAGHFIGDPGEQGKKIANGINHMFTRAETAKRLIEYVLTGGQWGLASPHLQGALSDGLKDANLVQVMATIDQLLQIAGPVQRSFAQLLLEETINHLTAPDAAVPDQPEDLDHRDVA